MSIATAAILHRPAPGVSERSSCPRLWPQLLLVALLAAPSSALADEQHDRVPPAGFQALRAVLRYLQPIPDALHFRETNPRDVVAIVLGRTGFLDRGFPPNVGEWLQKGGALLIATDRPGGDWQAYFDTFINGDFVQGDAASSYRGLADCPFVKPFAATDPSPFRGLDKIATNRPSFIVQSRFVLPRLAGFVRADLERAGIFAVGGPVETGRILVLADHSVFINDMMLQTDNQNLEFALSCVKWLSESGARKKVLLVEEGAIVPTLDFAFQDLPADVPVPRLPPISELVNQTVYELEQKNALPNFLYENVRPARLLRMVLVGLTGLLVILGLAGLLRNRHRVELGLARSEAEAPVQAEPAPVVEQRHHAMLQDGNLWEAARTSARHGLSALGAEAGTVPPPLVVAGSWWQRQRLRRQVSRLWQLAYGPEPQRISLAEFARLSELMAGVQAAWRRGQWHFATTESAGN